MRMQQVLVEKIQGHSMRSHNLIQSREGDTKDYKEEQSRKT